MQNNLLVKDVVSSPVVSPADSPLSFSSFDRSELLDVVPTPAIVSILLEDEQQLFQCCHELSVSLGSFVELPFKCRSGDNLERPCHRGGSLSRFRPCVSYLGQPSPRVSLLPATVLFLAPSNLLSEPKVSQVQVVFELVSIHHPGKRDPIFLEDEVFPFHLYAPGKLS